MSGIRLSVRLDDVRSNKVINYKNEYEKQYGRELKDTQLIKMSLDLFFEKQGKSNSIRDVLDSQFKIVTEVFLGINESDHDTPEKYANAIQEKLTKIKNRL